MPQAISASSSMANSRSASGTVLAFVCACFFFGSTSTVTTAPAANSSSGQSEAKPISKLFMVIHRPFCHRQDHQQRCQQPLGIEQVFIPDRVLLAFA